jgi:hypothetical protein
LEQLEDRMKHWTEYGNYGSSPPFKDIFSPGSSYNSRNVVDGHPSHKNSGQKLSPVSDGDITTGISGFSISPESSKSSDKRMPSKMGEKNDIDSIGRDSYTFYQV